MKSLEIKAETEASYSECFMKLKPCLFVLYTWTFVNFWLFYGWIWVKYDGTHICGGVVYRFSHLERFCFFMVESNSFDKKVQQVKTKLVHCFPQCLI